MTRFSDLMSSAKHMGISVQYDLEQSTGDDPDLMGSYDRRTNTIHLAAGLNSAQELVTLQHEIIHAIHCMHHCASPDAAKEELHTRRETARALISSHEYMIAERIYDGDIWHIAQDLGVTPSLIKDWQKLCLSA